MCLVLGCPASGCSTFLKTIANERAAYAGVSGDVRYAGIDNLEMNKHYRGEVVYNREGQRFLCLVSESLADYVFIKMIITLPH